VTGRVGLPQERADFCKLQARRGLHGPPQLFHEHDFPSGSETRRKGRPVITGRTSPSPKAITFSLTRDRIFGEDQSAKTRSFPAPAGM
jgi:hypothetical protein